MIAKYRMMQMDEILGDGPIHSYYTVLIVEIVNADNLKIIKRWPRITQYELHGYRKMAHDLTSRMNNGCQLPNVEMQLTS